MVEIKFVVTLKDEFDYGEKSKLLASFGNFGLSNSEPVNKQNCSSKEYSSRTCVFFNSDLQGRNQACKERHKNLNLGMNRFLWIILGFSNSLISESTIEKKISDFDYPTHV